MWPIEKFIYYAQQNGSLPSIVHFEEENKSVTFTYREVFNFYTKFKKVFAETMPCKGQCIGLMMDFNQYIPPIILSLLDNHSFIFLVPNGADNNIKIIDEVGLKWVITFKTSVTNLGYATKHVTTLLEGLELYCLDSKGSHEYSFNDIAYVIASSGTTGKPKLIRVKNFCILSNILSLRNVFNLESNDVIFFGTPLTFDPSVVELFLGLTLPCTLVSVSSKIKLNPKLLYKIISLKTVSFLQIVPSVFLRWGNEIIANVLSSSSLKILAFGGEKFPEIIRDFKINENIRIFNLYGISEVSCWASISKVSLDEEINLGIPLENTLLEVRDKEGLKIEEGEGELFIGSALRLCLIDKESSLSLEKPVFRATGDLVKLINNSFVFVSRMNNVIKRLGNKINLSQFEGLVFEIIGLNSAAVWSEKNKKLFLFVLVKTGYPEMKDKVKDKIKRKLIHSLPKEMFPDVLEIVSLFPVTNNGKINKNSLLDSYLSTQNNNQLSNSNISQTFEKLFAKSLGLDIQTLKTYKDLNFFEMGGTSFIFIQFVNEFEELFKTKIPEELRNNILNSPFYESSNYVENIFSHSCKRKLSDIDSIADENHCFKVLKRNGNVDLKLKWHYDLKGCINTSPVIVKYKNQCLVLCVSFYQVFAVINFDTGQMISEMIFPEPVQGGICAGDSGNAYVGCLDGIMYCLDVTNCQKIWTFKTDGIIKTTPCFCLGKKGIAFGSYDGYVYCLSTEGGNLMWKHNIGSSISINPIYNNKLKAVYLASSNKICFCLSESDGKMLWKYSVNSPVMGSPCSLTKLGHEDCILWPEVEGIVYCTKCTTGDLLWTYKAQNQIYSSIITYEKYFLFGCKDQNVYSVCVADNNNSCSLSFKICLNSAISSTPCIFQYKENTYIFAVTNNGSAFLIDFMKQKVLQEIKMNDEIFCSPIVYDNRILFGCNDNNLYCFSIENG